MTFDEHIEMTAELDKVFNEKTYVKNKLLNYDNNESNTTKSMYMASEKQKWKIVMMLKNESNIIYLCDIKSWLESSLNKNVIFKTKELNSFIITKKDASQAIKSLDNQIDTKRK